MQLYLIQNQNIQLHQNSCINSQHLDTFSRCIMQNFNLIRYVSSKVVPNLYYGISQEGKQIDLDFLNIYNRYILLKQQQQPQRQQQTSQQTHFNSVKDKRVKQPLRFTPYKKQEKKM